jgi:hypothetical protein
MATKKQDVVTEPEDKEPEPTKEEREAQEAAALVEDLARSLHDSGREAVQRGLVVNRNPGQPFLEWDQVTEAAREGRRLQARYLIANRWVTAKPTA